MLSETIIKSLKSTNRPGIDKVITYLVESDFFTAPASSKFHSNFIGGLAEHSFSVARLFYEKVERYDLPIPADTVTIAGLLHDICKINTYKRGIKNVKDGKKINFKGQEVDNWIEKEVWEREDKYNIGHGEKSVIILQKMIELTDMEIMLIRFHMGTFNVALYEYNEAVKYYPAIVALFTSDMESSYLLEGRGE